MTNYDYIKLREFAKTRIKTILKDRGHRYFKGDFEGEQYHYEDALIEEIKWLNEER